jgi:hypothetical protein
MLSHTITRPAVVLAVATTLLTAVSQAMESTARARLAQAQRAAASWQSDATLTRVDTTILKENGTAVEWQYDFLSPGTGTCARIITGVGDPRTQDLGTCATAKPVSANFVDSPAVVTEAIKAGYKPDGPSNAYLSFVNDSALAERECWVLFTAKDVDAEAIAIRGWCIDPKTGHFIGRLSGQTRARKP